MKIRKVNEMEKKGTLRLESGHMPWAHLFNSCENIKLNPKGRYREADETWEEWMDENKIDPEEDFTFSKYDYQEFEGGYMIFKHGLCFIFKGETDTPFAVIHEPYEMSNPTEFKGVIILPGHDYIRLFDLTSAETIKHHIR